MLYLDTARLGPMVPPAQRAQIDFVRLAAEEPTSLYFEEFLRHGFAAWPAAYQERFPGLGTWPGVAGFKNALRTMLGASTAWDVRLASRSLPLLRHGARSLAEACRHVMTTDLSWRSYQSVVRHELRRRDRGLTTLPLRRQVLRDGWSADDVSSFLAAEYQRRGCDGLFLPAVDHLGVRVPIGAIAERITSRDELRYLLIDAAQGFCQVPLADCLAYANFIVAGAHKWMGAYLPLGIAWTKWSAVVGCQDEFHAKGATADPLTRFTEQLVGASAALKTETVNAVPLFTAAAAAAAPVARDMSIDEIESRVSSLTCPSGDWLGASVSPTMASRIRILREARPCSNRKAAEQVRCDWLAAGCVVTGYDGGVARLAIPSLPSRQRWTSSGNLANSVCAEI